MSAGAAFSGGDRIFDHNEVRRALASFSRSLSTISATQSPSVVAVRAGTAACEHLEAVLLAHFRYEEAEAGFFSEVLEMAPTLARDLDALRGDHPRLAEELARVAEDARWAGLSGEAWRRVAGRFDSFAQHLERHEHAEDLLVADALLIDEGGSG